MPKAKLEALLCEKSVQTMLVMVSRRPSRMRWVWHLRHDLGLLAALKRLKYFWNLPQRQLVILLASMAREFEGPSGAAHLEAFQQELTET